MKYRSLMEVDAVQFTGENSEEIISFINDGPEAPFVGKLRAAVVEGKGLIIKGAPMTFTEWPVNPFDWVFRVSNNNVCIDPDDEFRRRFEVKPERPADHPEYGPYVHQGASGKWYPNTPGMGAGQLAAYNGD